ncbi:MAG: hypothetical protein OEY14_14305 [Myxococcales bacterium]|nr:hypothetical protein [Myxococcales bacterium]
MVSAALPELEGPRLDAILDRADGHPFFLEELARAVAAGRDELPETALAVAKEHRGQVDPETRRAPQAASVFG